MNKLRVFWKYHTELPRKFYFEGEEPPQPSIAELKIDGLAKRVTKGKYGWGSANLHPHRCAVCGKVFWSEKRDDAELCQNPKRYSLMPHTCYVEYHRNNRKEKADGS